MKVKKVYAAIRVSREALYFERMMFDGRYARKAIRTETPPTPEVWARYYAAKAALNALNAYEFTQWGGLDYGTSVPEPEPSVNFEYLETNDEWLARCEAMEAERK